MASAASPPPSNEKPVPDAANSNIDAVANIYDWHEQRLSPTQAFIEKASLFFGRPSYLIIMVVFIAGWVAANLAAPYFQRKPIDPPPFSMIEGFITLNAFLITTAVLIRQNRMAKMAERHAHLDLQVNLMTDEKASKILTLLEQLQNELSDGRHARDPEVEELKQPIDAGAMLGAIETKHNSLQADTES